MFYSCLIENLEKVNNLPKALFKTKNLCFFWGEGLVVGTYPEILGFPPDCSEITVGKSPGDLVVKRIKPGLPHAKHILYAQSLLSYGSSPCFFPSFFFFLFK